MEKETDTTAYHLETYHNRADSVSDTPCAKKCLIEIETGRTHKFRQPIRDFFIISCL